MPSDDDVTSERERALVATLDPARVESDLRAIFAIPCVTDDEGPVQDRRPAFHATAEGPTDLLGTPFIATETRLSPTRLDVTCPPTRASACPT